ncbi:hypothetical protein MSAN_00443500 [Mycena sanguinolenta]|uniref:Uncharacterized protein n=1 Tax=Mycena sanguinolenta TaxID=230812 RepID=A0A8H7DKE2_9AGAR|nr:hypothetical protein MSAN_00443500 [Mycena sanguinolenta]
MPPLFVRGWADGVSPRATSTSVPRVPSTFTNADPPPAPIRIRRWCYMCVGCRETQAAASAAAAAVRAHEVHDRRLTLPVLLGPRPHSHSALTAASPSTAAALPGPQAPRARADGVLVPVHRPCVFLFRCAAPSFLRSHRGRSIPAARHGECRALEAVSAHTRGRSPLPCLPAAAGGRVLRLHVRPPPRFQILGPVDNSGYPCPAELLPPPTLVLFVYRIVILDFSVIFTAASSSSSSPLSPMPTPPLSKARSRRYFMSRGDACSWSRCYSCAAEDYRHARPRSLRRDRTPRLHALEVKYQRGCISPHARKIRAEVVLLLFVRTRGARRAVRGAF